MVLAPFDDFAQHSFVDLGRKSLGRTMNGTSRQGGDEHWGLEWGFRR